MASARTLTHSREAVTKEATYTALLDAAEAWDALTPQERHEFARRYQALIRATSLPSAWLRVRAYKLGA